MLPFFGYNKKCFWLYTNLKNITKEGKCRKEVKMLRRRIALAGVAALCMALWLTGCR